MKIGLLLGGWVGGVLAPVLRSFFKDEQYVDDLVEIFKNYVSGWFAVDLLTSLPISFVMLCIPKGFLDQGYSGAVRTPRMLRLLKTLKVRAFVNLDKQTFPLKLFFFVSVLERLPYVYARVSQRSTIAGAGVLAVRC